MSESGKKWVDRCKISVKLATLPMGQERVNDEPVNRYTVAILVLVDVIQIVVQADITVNIGVALHQGETCIVISMLEVVASFPIALL